jgi:hypothetical protein
MTIVGNNKEKTLLSKKNDLAIPAHSTLVKLNSAFCLALSNGCVSAITVVEKWMVFFLPSS